MKLYFSPGACSLSPNITLREAGLPFTLERVDLKAKQIAGGADYRAINPKGYVPALLLDNGELLTEGAVIVQYVADQVPDRKLAPPAGTMPRYRLQEMLNFIATELHKGVSPLYNARATDELKASIRERVASRWAVMAKHLEGKKFVMGDTFTVADPYLFYTLRSWKKLASTELDDQPSLKAFFTRLSDRPSVQAALEAEAKA